MAMAWAVLLPPNQINQSSLLPGFATLFASFVQCNRAVLSRPDCAIVLSCGWPSHHATTHTSCPHAATCHHCRRSGLHALPRVLVCPPMPPPAFASYWCVWTDHHSVAQTSPVAHLEPRVALELAFCLLPSAFCPPMPTLRPRRPQRGLLLPSRWRHPRSRLRTRCVLF